MAKQVEIRRGTTRDVVLVGSYAFKFPTLASWRQFLGGLLANLCEYDWWKSGFMRDHLCPITFRLPGGFLVVMRRASPLTKEEYDGTDFDDFAGLPMDNHIENFGKLDGRTVMVDYSGTSSR